MGTDVTGSEGAPEGRRPAAAGRGPLPVLRRAGAALALVVLLLAGVGWYFYQRYDSNITVDSATARELLRYEEDRPEPDADGAADILLIGSDARPGEPSGTGRAAGAERSDTAVLLHLAGDRDSVTAVSIPRDLMVDIPDCRGRGGGWSGQQVNLFNFAYAYGGAACTIRVVEELVGVRVDHHVIADFHGFKQIVDAVDGVEVCLRRPMRDKAADLRLRAGRQVLDGEQALGYVRARKSLGDGSDTERMARQQEFMASLVNKVQSNDVLFNPLRLAPLLDAVTRSLTANKELSSLSELYDLVRSVRDVPRERVHFLTVPRRPYRLDANRDELLQPDADALFTALRKDRMVRFAAGSGRRSPEGERGGAGRDHRYRHGVSIRDGGELPATAPPVFKGTTPADDICR